MKIKYSIVFLSFLLFIPQLLKSQTDTTLTSTDANLDNYSSAMINLSYTNNNLENLSGETENIPTLFSNISYFHKSGIYADFGYAKYFGDITSSKDFDINAGYQKYFLNGFNFDINYTWHKYSGDTIMEGFNYNHATNLIMEYELGKFSISTDLTYYMGNTNNYGFDLNLSRFISIDKIFFKTDALYINPTLSASFGTDYWLFEDMSESEQNSLFADLKKSGYTYETFSYESFNFYLPVSYGIGNIYFTFSWLYKVPSSKYKYIGWENQSSIMLSLSYFLNFNKNTN